MSPGDVAACAQCESRHLTPYPQHPDDPCGEPGCQCWCNFDTERPDMTEREQELVPVGVRLTPRNVEWLDGQPASRTATVDALITFAREQRLSVIPGPRVERAQVAEPA